ncbi:MAG: hypothetical protein OEW45_17540 [Deltaproteobacteria bacterium]|nr:hypothetical protein [Deltaproteobacteria bacterium]
MKCARCEAQIKQGKEIEYHGRILCEDCYMDALSPARACNPWAVYTAKSLSNQEGAVSETQAKILSVLKQTGGVEPNILAEMLQMKLTDLEREIAALRHMEKVRAKMKDDRKVICLW